MKFAIFLISTAVLAAPISESGEQSPKHPHGSNWNNDDLTVFGEEMEEGETEDDFVCDLEGRPKRIRTRTVTVSPVLTRVRLRTYRVVCSKDNKITREIIGENPELKSFKTGKNAKVGKKTRQTFKTFESGKITAGSIHVLSH